MPVSLWHGMEDCVARIVAAQPRAVLDVGVGFGLWGALLRQYLDVMSGRIQPAQWTTRIDGLELDRRRIQAHHRHLYSDLFIGDLRREVPRLVATTRYDLVLFGDVLEHVEKADALAVLRAAVDAVPLVLVRIPLGDGWRRKGREPPDHHRSQWTAADFVPFDAVVKTYDFVGNPYALVTIDAGVREARAHLRAIDGALARIEARLARLAGEETADAR